MHPSASAGVRLSAIVALAALVIFIVCPLGSIFITSFTGSENESLLVQHALDAALASENVETVVNSIVLAGLVVVLTTVMATPLALLLSRTSWGQSHWLDVALLIPFMTTIMKNALIRVPGNLEEAAAVSGAGFSKRLKQVLLPLVTGNYAIAMLLVFVKTLAEYGTPSTLGRRIGFDVFTTKIHAYATTAPVNFGAAATLSLILITICMAMWMLQSWITANRSFRLVGAKGARPAFWKLSGWPRRAAALYIGIVLLLAVGVPWFSVIATSLIKIRGYGLALGNFTLMHYVELFTENPKGLDAFVTSLMLALSVGFIASLLGTVIVWLIRHSGRMGRLLEGIGLLPEMLPSIVMAIGLMLFWNQIYTWIPLYNTMGFMVLVYVILFLPYAIQYTTSAWMQVSPSLREAGSVCGGSPFFVLTRITLPLIAVGIVQGFIMIFIIVLRELVAASLISPPDVLVISTFIVNEFEQGSASVAMAMALICVLVSALMLFALRMLLSRMKHISAV